MAYTKVCKYCGKPSTLSESDVHELSRTEQLLCEKEGLAWITMVKIECKACGTASLVQRSELAVAGATAAPHALTDSPGRKRCPDCAEEVNADARICRFCRHDFAADEAALRTLGTVIGAMATQAVEETARRATEAKLARIRKWENSKVLVIVMIHVGLIAPAGILIPVIQQQERTGVEPPAFLVVVQLAIYGAFALLAVRQWRKAKRMRAVLASDAEREGLHLECVCGRPIRNYSLFHYFLVAILIPWGYLALLAPLKKCRDCGRPYRESLLRDAGPAPPTSLATTFVRSSGG